MNLIKLNATESTSSYLKELSRTIILENFTVVVAKEQTLGRGQRVATWDSESGKNLTFSVLVKFEDLDIKHGFYLSKAVSLAVFECLQSVLDVKIVIKWPNDILAAQSKIAGILIENSVKKTKISQSVIGIGLNVNQDLFKDLPNATSMKLISKREFDLDLLLKKLIDSIKRYVKKLNEKEFELLDSMYLKQLYKLNQPAMYKNVLGELFMGKIIGVSSLGLLQMELENETVQEFDLKEVQFYE